MELLVVSFLAGVLTVLAPCILPLLPVIVGGTAASGEKDIKRPLLIAVSLAGSVIIFTLLLKASTSLIMVPAYVWQVVSGGIIIIFGLSLLFETAWARVAVGLNQSSNKLLGKAAQRHGWIGAILVGAAIYFNKCGLKVYAIFHAEFG